MSEDMDEDFQGTDRPIRGFEQADGEDGFDDRDWVEKELHEAEEAAREREESRTFLQARHSQQSWLR